MVILYNFVFWYPVEKMSKYRICVSDDGITKRALREERVDLQYAFIIIRLKVRANHHHQGGLLYHLTTRHYWHRCRTEKVLAPIALLLPNIIHRKMQKQHRAAFFGPFSFFHRGRP